MSYTYHLGPDNTAKFTDGPVEGMQEIVLTLQGTGWSITEMKSESTADGDITIITMSK